MPVYWKQPALVPASPHAGSVLSREDPDQPLSRWHYILLLVIKTQFHFSWMYIDVYMFTVNLDMQYHERILVLHGKIFICVFNGSGNDIILGISSIDIIIFKITVSSGNDWFPEIL